MTEFKIDGHVKPMKNTDVQLATCNRCGAYVFAALVNGFKTAVDPKPLDGPQGLADAFRDRRMVYVLLERAGRPWRLLPVHPGITLPRKPLAKLAEHACGAHGMDTRRAEVTPVGPQRPSATPGGHRGGFPPPTVPAGPQTATTPREAVELANPRRSKPTWVPPQRRYRCATCKQIIKGEMVAIEWGRDYIWAHHAEECT